MASRQVTLLTRGYLTGRLDFKYKTPLSRLRERHILNEIEKELFKEFLVLRAQVDATVLSSIAGRSKEAFEAPYKSVDSYSEIVLPYHYKKDNIDPALGPVDADFNAQWKAILDDIKKQKIKEQEEKK